MGQAIRSRGRLGLVLGLGLQFLATGAALAANDLFTYAHAGPGYLDFRLSGDGKVFAYIVDDFPDSIVSTLVRPDGSVTLPEGVAISGLSFDGSVVVGNGPTQGFVLKHGVTTTIGDFTSGGQSYSYANAISRDGTVVVGRAQTDDDGGHAFRLAGGVLTDLGLLPSAESSNATLLSADGKVVTGDSHVGGFDIAFVWSTDRPVMTQLGSLGGIGSYAFGISADGTTIVGRADSDLVNINDHAYRWTNDTGMVDLGTFGGNFSEAWAVSADGSVVVGGADTSADNTHAFRWTEGDGMIDLGTIGGTGRRSEAFALSDDGRVVVGLSEDEAQKTTGFRWDARHGMMAVGDYLAAAGVDVDGWTFSDVRAISADGLTMAGRGAGGRNTTGVWYARCDTGEACGVTTPELVSQSFASLGALGEAGNSYLEDDFAALGNVVGHAAPGVSATAYGSFDSDPAASGGIVVTARGDKDLVAAFGFGAGRVVTLLDFAGSASFNALSLSASLGQLPTAGFSWRLGATGALFDGTVKRGYLNGNTPVQSSGDASAQGFGAEALVGWRAELMADTTALTYASLGLERTAYAGWTETGGPFPASFAGFALTSALLRGGVTVDHDFGHALSASAGIALVHGQASGTPIRGTVSGIISMDMPVTGSTADWLELKGGLALPVGTGTGALDITARLPAGGSPSVLAQIGLNLPL